MSADFFDALRGARQRYLNSGAVDHLVRPFVAASWARCAGYGVHPSRLKVQPVDHDLLQRLQAQHGNLLAAADPVLQEVNALVPHRHLLALADEKGRIVRLLTDATSPGDDGASVNLFEGASWAEEDIGCNGVGTALATGAPVVLVGAEHFQEAYVGWTCIGIPLRAPDGRVAGVLDLSVPNESANAHTWGWMLAVARMIETRLATHKLIAVPEPHRPFDAVRGILKMIGSHVHSSEGKAVDTGELERQVNEAESQLLSAVETVRQRTSQLNSVKRDKNESMAALAHELRGPLFALVSCIEMLKSDGTDQDTLEWARNVLDRQVSQMRSLVDDLMDLAQAERGRIELKLQDLELRDVVEQAALTVQHELKARHLSLESSIPGVRLRGDRMRLVQIMTNLLGNAARYNRHGGRITVIASVTSSNEVEIRVADTGMGIEPEILPRIFEPFVQGRMKKRGGLGLGLPLVRRLVQLHGGTISVESEGVGKGTEVIVRLPALVESVNTRRMQQGARA